MSAVEPIPPALGDSWASLTDFESSNEEDLRSEHTDVGSLLDVHSSDDVQSIADETDVVPFIYEEEVTFEEYLHGQQPLGASIQEPAALAHSATGSVEANCAGTDSQETIRHATSQHSIVRPLSELENSFFRRCLNEDVSSNYYSVIRMPLLEEGLSVDALDYFKVILLGPHVDQFKPEIQRKLGDALVSRKVSATSSSSSSVSRFHIVPSCFGPGSEPEFADLVAIDKLIDFECYDLAGGGRSVHHLAPLILKSSQTHSTVTSEWNGHAFAVTNPRWILPDLAIICVRLDQKHNLDTDSLAMLEFADRHRIPTILIRLDRGWLGNYGKAMNTDYLYESIESDPEQASAQVLTSKLPLDIPTFLNIDSALLNKHIAYSISSSAAERSYEDSVWVDLSNLTGGKEFRGSKPSSPVSPSLKQIFLILCIVGLHFFLGAQLWPLISDGLSNKSVSTTNAVGMPNIAIAASLGDAHPLSQIRQSGQASQALGQGARKSSLPETPHASPSANPVSSLGEDETHFQVSIVSRGQLMVKLPGKALGHKKRSQLEVVVMKANQALPTQVQELFDGIFGVQVHPGDTYGDIEVNLTMIQPPFSETLTLSLEGEATNQNRSLNTRLHTINGTLQGIINALSTSLPVWPSRNPLQTLARDAKRVKKDLKDNIAGWWTSQPLSKRSVLEKLSTVRKRGLTGAECVYADMARLTDQGVTQGQRILSKFTDEIRNAQGGLLRLFKSVDGAQPTAESKAGLLAKKLGAAQGRARHIVSSASGRLTPRNAHG
ncbi:hypothetical protein A1O1_02607 [Capronia coronata CBS 617.96]|uniref:Uncharacterized protein n=1 Tax=Capronia coronata CBS 617.96 TaxID=1182541 RepID=W9ZI76_9EURO|nr:uncharacterized protein A1O1_02607 [Capronia coronata CBS 617.96]EXJ94214.1 hypothetical protein A1O1_02607 [Capronia coronata CBS 617.96]